MKKLIQGFFFQNRDWCDVVHLSETEGGARAVLNEELCRYMFAGVIFDDEKAPGFQLGRMMDAFGESTLTGITVTENIAYFTKKYDHRSDFIDYEFELQNGIWVGKYSGQATGTGMANCVITDVPESFFLLPE